MTRDRRVQVTNQTMPRYDDFDENDEYFDDYESEADVEDDVDDEFTDELDEIPESAHTTGENSVEVSLEIDADGNEVWIADDSLVPGSSSMGHSVEEAIDGVEERRRQYREMLRRSREKRTRRAEDEQ